MSYFSLKPYAVTPHLNRLNEAVLRVGGGVVNIIYF